jgi:hypothetical protein
MHPFRFEFTHRSFLCSLIAGAGMSAALAHPLPDLPVRAHFQTDGSVEIRVEVDPRCFEPDPEAEGYIMKGQIENLTPEEVRAMEATANQFIEQRLRFLFDPQGEMKPKFTWKFQKLGDKGDLEDPADGVVLIGSWKPVGLSGATSYRLQALELTPEKMGIPLNVLFLNFIGGQQADRFGVLFPGETSFGLDLASLPKSASVDAAPETAGELADSERPAFGRLPLMLAGVVALAVVAWGLSRVVR